MKVEKKDFFFVELLFKIRITMNKFLTSFVAVCLSTQTFSNELDTPQFLYKILSTDSWEESQGERSLELSSDDNDFIHFSLDTQVDRILTKYWANKSAVVLKIDVTKLSGDLVFEANPGGSAKYYHLYNGEIPLESVVEATPWK